MVVEARIVGFGFKAFAQASDPESTLSHAKDNGKNEGSSGFLLRGLI